MQRLFSVSRSPVLSHFSESLGGLSTIRAFGSTTQFEQDNIDLVNTSSTCFYLSMTLFRWAVLRVEVLNAVGTFITAAIVVAQRESISPAFVGAVLNFSLSTGGILGFAVMLATDLEVCVGAPVWLCVTPRRCLLDHAFVTHAPPPPTETPADVVVLLLYLGSVPAVVACVATSSFGAPTLSASLSVFLSHTRIF
jgi:hypothetical protein